MATSTEIGKDALEKLGALEGGGTPSTADQTTMDNIYASVYQELRARHLVDWASTDDIPAWARLHVVDIVANRAANRFGQPRNADEEALAFRHMAKHLAAEYDGEATPATYF